MLYTGRRGEEKSMPSTPTVPPAVDELLAALERYASHVAQLTGRWMDAELYHTVSQDVDAVRRGCQGLPGADSAWIALLIAHAELMHALWQASSQPAREGSVERGRLLAKVQGDVAALQGIAMRLAGRG